MTQNEKIHKFACRLVSLIHGAYYQACITEDSYLPEGSTTWKRVTRVITDAPLDDLQFELIPKGINFIIPDDNDKRNIILAIEEDTGYPIDIIHAEQCIVGKDY